MTRKRKVAILIQLGEDIKYHFVQYAKQKRLVIDAIRNNDGTYSIYFNTSAQQTIAGERIDKMFNKYTKGGNEYDNN